MELEATWPRVGAFLWLWAWRGALGGGLIVGILTALLNAINVPLAISLPLTWVVGLAWQAVVIRMALLKKYSDFRIALIPREPTPKPV